jgi:hypothetical protein
VSSSLGVTGVNVFELVAAGLIAIGGLRSLVRWIGTDFDATSAGEQMTFLLHATARVGLWFAFAGFFLGYALVDEPRRFGWYVLVPIALAGVQLLTGVLLARSGGPEPPAE